MKKLLLFAVLALGVIACDKNNLGEMDEMSINPIEIAVDASINEQMVLDLIGRLQSQKFPKSTATHTAKNTTDYIKIVTGVVDGVWYEFAFSDDHDTCDELGITTFYLSAGPEDTLDVQFDLDGEVLLNLDLNINALFANDVVFGVSLTQDGVVGQGTVDGLQITF